MSVAPQTPLKPGADVVILRPDLLGRYGRVSQVGMRYTRRRTQVEIVYVHIDGVGVMMIDARHLRRFGHGDEYQPA